jgi:hypothetical protein
MTLLRGSVLAACAALTFSQAAHAALGGNTQSVQADVQQMNASTATAAQVLAAGQPQYTTLTMTLERGTVVREYVSPSDVVFAVTWRGPQMPNLSQILGSSYTNASTAVQSYRAQHPGFGPLAVSANGLVIEVSGHMGFYVGRAYLAAAVPAGVNVSELQ